MKEGAGLLSPNEGFFERHPVKRTWLVEIVDFLARQPKGTARVDDIAYALCDTRSSNRAVAETITRAINNHCRDAYDFNGKREAYFTRVEPGVYRLDAFPNRPKIPDSGGVEFSDPVDAVVYRYFFLPKIMKLRSYPNWIGMSRQEQMAAFNDDERLRNLFEKLKEIAQTATADI